MNEAFKIASRKKMQLNLHKMDLAKKSSVFFFFLLITNLFKGFFWRQFCLKIELFEYQNNLLYKKNIFKTLKCYI